MNNQKKIFEIFIYVLLLTVGLFFYLNDDTPIIKIDCVSPSHQVTEEDVGLQEVPQELITYDFKFEGD